jgi:hypothetical protein
MLAHATGTSGGLLAWAQCATVPLQLKHDDTLFSEYRVSHAATIVILHQCRHPSPVH